MVAEVDWSFEKKNINCWITQRWRRNKKTLFVAFHMLQAPRIDTRLIQFWLLLSWYFILWSREPKLWSNLNISKYPFYFNTQVKRVKQISWKKKTSSRLSWVHFLCVDDSPCWFESGLEEEKEIHEISDFFSVVECFDNPKSLHEDKIYEMLIIAWWPRAKIKFLKIIILILSSQNNIHRNWNKTFFLYPHTGVWSLLDVQARCSISPPRDWGEN